MLHNTLIAIVLLLTTSNLASHGVMSTLSDLRFLKSELLERTDSDYMAEQVKGEFLHAWNAYKEYAWGHDELKPLSRGHKDWYEAPLLITAVESLDTMLIMGLQKEADENREYIATHLSFDHDMKVRVFEINIRLLGGLLSGYQLSGDQRLLALAEDLGRRLLPAFSSPTGMPYTHVNLRTGEATGAVSNPAEIGSYVLEFGTLSKLTNNVTYFDTAKRALAQLYKKRSDNHLVGAEIDVVTGMWMDETSHIGGGIDSYYEYLLKCALLFGDKECQKMWDTSKEVLHYFAEDSNKHGLWYSRVNMISGLRVETHFASLDAFFAGIMVLDGDLERARRLQETYVKVWNQHGAMPESLDYGEWRVMWAPYLLRPEIIESAFYLYRATGDEQYRAMGRRIFADLVRHCRVENGYSALLNIGDKSRSDEMESFFMSETLKYLYLLFASPDILPLAETIFTTEAHPLKKERP